MGPWAMRDMWGEVRKLAEDIDGLAEMAPVERIRRTVELRARMMVLLAAVRHDAIAEKVRALARLRRRDEERDE